LFLCEATTHAQDILGRIKQLEESNKQRDADVADLKVTVAEIKKTVDEIKSQLTVKIAAPVKDVAVEKPTTSCSVNCTCGCNETGTCTCGAITRSITVGTAPVTSQVVPSVSYAQPMYYSQPLQYAPIYSSCGPGGCGASFGGYGGYAMPMGSFSGFGGGCAGGRCR
jgi:hypothetical protein